MKTRSLSVLYVCAALLFVGACGRHAPPRPAPITGTATSADGVAIKYESVGEAWPALVFIHCWTCNRSFWNDQVGQFANRYQVVRLDLGGHGESGQGRKVYTMPAFGADVAAVVDHLGLKQVILIGHSMGGPVAMEAEKLLGTRVIGVVGVDTFHTGFRYPSGSEVAEFIKPIAEDFAGATDKFVRSMFMASTDPALVDRIAKNFASADKEMAISALKEIFAWFERDAESAFRRVGSRLRNINADPEGDKRPLEGSVVLIRGVGHFVPQERPTEFNRVLDEIVKQFVDGAKKT